VARNLPNPLERRTIQWAAIYSDNGNIDYNAIKGFAAEAPTFSSPGFYKTRLEQSLVKHLAPGAEVIKQLAGSVPNTIDAQIALAAAYRDAGQTDRATRLAHSIWVDNFLDKPSEDKVLAQLGSLLTRADHWARVVHLLMNDRASGTDRLLAKLSPAQKSLAVAGSAVARSASNAQALLDKVDPSMRGSALHLFMAAQQARAGGKYDKAVKLLDAAKGTLPDSAQWWYERRTLVRQLLGTGDAKLAYRAAAGYSHGPDGRLVEAHFHAGWIALSFLHDPKTAVQHFTKMQALSTLPDSLTQADFWLGKAYAALGDKAAATAAYTSAARYGTLYYGLLARAELGMKGVEMRGLPAWQSSQAAFDANEIVRAVRLLSVNGQTDLAQPLLRNFASDLNDGGQLLLAARLAQSINAHHLAISIADIADQRGTPLDLFSFPKDGLPANAQLASIDKAAIYAIARQESRFQIDAVSSSGALGLMQLMPATAKETAGKMGVSYSQSRLTTDPGYNAALGSTYLAGQLQRFSGSLVLAAAAYNAGGGNAAKWIAAYGDPRASNVDAVTWVELIPFEETRSYVRKVLGNYIVYRSRLGNSDMTLEQALKRITS
jgi:soluble lytic murein transglycosylase